MTTGQRIAQKRKELGLSQEALGERLGVSRQAIYKWESDAALPEIEKLVNLSREFSVSVDWLLGVEENTATGADDQSGSGQLTEEQLNMVEEIVNRYLDAQAKTVPARRGRLFKVCLAIAVVCLVVVFVNLFSRLDQMQNNYSNLQYSMNNVTYNVDSQISSITDRVEEILKSQNDLTASYSAEIAATDYAAGTVTFDLKATPKTYTQGMTALFIATGESSGKVEGVLGAGNEFSAQLTCALTNDITLSVVFDTGDKQETQMLDNYWYLLYDSYDNVIISSGLDILDTNDGQIWQQEAAVMVFDDNGNSAINTLQDLRLGLFRDQKLLMWYEPLAEQENDELVNFTLPENVTLEEGYTYCVAAILTDQYGRTWVEYNSTAVTYNKESKDTSFVDTNYSTDPAEWDF